MPILAAAVNENVINLVFIGFIVMLLSFVVKKAKQPVIIAYIIAGVIVGPSGYGLIQDGRLISIFGEVGLILLMFFIGMEIDLPNLVGMWRRAFAGVFFQVLFSILIFTVIGYLFSWDKAKVIVLGFALALSSSAVVIKLLEDKNELHTTIGKNVVSILLMQDVLIVPMLIITEYLAAGSIATKQLVLQIIGSIFIVGILIYIIKKRTIHLPFTEKLNKDHEAQVLVALTFALGFAIFTGYLGLSAALGAFIGGIIVHAADSTDWFHDSLHSFRVVFVSSFFVSIGMLIDLQVLLSNWYIVLLMIVSVYLSNHLINSFILMGTCKDWRNSAYGGAMLGQAGELGFIILSMSYASGIINEYIYQLAILTIALTLLMSPVWIQVTKWVVFRGKSPICPIDPAEY